MYPWRPRRQPRLPRRRGRSGAPLRRHGCACKGQRACGNRRTHAHTTNRGVLQKWRPHDKPMRLGRMLSFFPRGGRGRPRDFSTVVPPQIRGLLRGPSRAGTGRSQSRRDRTCTPRTSPRSSCTTVSFGPSPTSRSALLWQPDTRRPASAHCSSAAASHRNCLSSGRSRCRGEAACPACRRSAPAWPPPLPRAPPCPLRTGRRGGGRANDLQGDRLSEGRHGAQGAGCVLAACRAESGKSTALHAGRRSCAGRRRQAKARCCTQGDRLAACKPALGGHMQMGWVRTHVLKRSNTQAKAHALALRSVLLQAEMTMPLQGGPARTWKREKHGH